MELARTVSIVAGKVFVPRVRSAGGSRRPEFNSIYNSGKAYGLHVIRMSDPTNPNRVGLYTPPSEIFPALVQNVFLSRNHAYLSVEGLLMVVNVSDPHNRGA